MEAPNNIILPALILVPFIAGFICWIVDKLDDKLPRYIALVGMLVTLGLTLALWQSCTTVALHPSLKSTCMPAVSPRACPIA